jgi:hypothetical protein
MPNNRDSGTYTRGTGVNPPADPVLSQAVTAYQVGYVITYTATQSTNLVVGQPVTITGFSTTTYNYTDGSNRNLNTTGTLNSSVATEGVVASVSTDKKIFTITAPVSATVDSEGSQATGGTLVQDSLVTKSQWGQTWLPTANASATGAASISQPRIDRAWGKNNAIQPNDDRLTGAQINSASGNGTQVTYVMSTTAHGLVSGQTVTIQGLTPSKFNLDAVQLASASSGTTSVVVNSTVTGSVTATSTGSVIVPRYTTGGQTITVASATGASGTSSVKVLTYTTNQDHNLRSGQVVSVLNASNINYNVRDAVVTTTGAKTFTVTAPDSQIVSVSGTNGSGVVGDGTNVLYNTGIVAHGLVGGDVVSIYNMAPSGYNATNATVLTSPAPTVTTFAIANTTATAVTAYGLAFKNSGTFTAPATVSVGDNGWSGTYSYPSAQLVPDLDNHDTVTKAAFIAGDAYATLTVPGVVGLYNTPEAPNAIRVFKAAGFTNVTDFDSAKSTASSQITAVSGNGTIWTYTASAHGLVAGQLVTVQGVGAFNVTNAVISTTATNTFSVANTTQPTALSSLTGVNQGVWSAYNGLAATFSLAATAAGSVMTVTTTADHGLRVGDIIGIGGFFTSVTGVGFAYLPGSVTSTNYAANTLTTGTAVTAITGPKTFTYATPTDASSTTLALVSGSGRVLAYNGIVTAQSLTAGSTSTTPSTVGTITSLPGTSAVQY